MSDEERHSWAIGELADKTGVTVRTLRYYDRIRLLTPSTRSSGSHRRYGVSEVQRLYRILVLRSFGFSLSAISRLLARDRGEALVEAVHQQLDHVSRQVALYEELRVRLTQVLEALERSEAPSLDQLLRAMEVTAMTVRLTSIYTRDGDAGDTRLGDASRVSKTDPHIRACGDVDELSSHIGVALVGGDLSERAIRWLRRIQNDLYDVGADLAVPTNDIQENRLRVGREYVRWLEERCDEVNSTLEPLSSFVLPGGTRGAAHLQVCRTVCRRAERNAVEIKKVNPEVLRYLNRLSDLLFILARGENGASEQLWNPGRHAAAAS
jgi:cob(I)alamin adenosyltransferase